MGNTKHTQEEYALRAEMGERLLQKIRMKQKEKVCTLP